MWSEYEKIVEYERITKEDYNRTIKYLVRYYKSGKISEKALSQLLHTIISAYLESNVTYKFERLNNKVLTFSHEIEKELIHG